MSARSLHRNSREIEREREREREREERERERERERETERQRDRERMNKLYFTRVVEKTRGVFTSSPRP